MPTCVFCVLHGVSAAQVFQCMGSWLHSILHKDDYTIVFEIPGWVLIFEDQTSNGHIWQFKFSIKRNNMETVSYGSSERGYWMWNSRAEQGPHPKLNVFFACLNVLMSNNPKWKCKWKFILHFICAFGDVSLVHSNTTYFPFEHRKY